MNTRTLVVGQKIWMQSGDQLKEATVKEITEHYTDVEPALVENERRYMIRFNKRTGRQAGVFLYLGTFGWAEYDRRPVCTEFGPWEYN